MPSPGKYCCAPHVAAHNVTSIARLHTQSLGALHAVCRSLVLVVTVLPQLALKYFHQQYKLYFRTHQTYLPTHQQQQQQQYRSRSGHCRPTVASCVYCMQASRH